MSNSQFCALLSITCFLLRWTLYESVWLTVGGVVLIVLAGALNTEKADADRPR